MAKILITGGAGFVGSHLSDKLIELGHSVVIYDNLSVGKLANVPKKAVLVVGDILDLDDLLAVAADVDVIFHLAARVSVRASMDQFRKDAEINLNGTLNVLEALAFSKARKIIFASSMAVYPDKNLALTEDVPVEPMSFYGISKMAAERYICLAAEQTKKQAVILRYFNIYGPRQTYTPYVGVITIFIERLLRGEAPVIFGDGLQRRDFVSVHDVVDANILAMRWPGSCGVFNVGTGRGTTIRDLATLLIKKIAPSVEPLYGEEKPGELRDAIARTFRAKICLDFRAKRVLEDAIDEVIEYIRKKNGK